MKNQIGIIGLAVMGKNLAYNFADHGYKTAVYNRTTSVTDAVMAEAQAENPTLAENLDPHPTLQAFVQSLEAPRKIILMIKAGAPVDSAIADLQPLLEPNDIIIDGGNSYFKDTERRSQTVEAAGFTYLGLGVSGGEKGARFGPAMMPGGDRAAYDAVADMLRTVSAQYKGEPCCEYTSKGGAGHFVKMVHNGIEYADMELIAETYYVLKHQEGLSNAEIAKVFAEWNTGELASYLIEITAKILVTKDPETTADLVDMIQDISHQKGTGKWTTQEAAELGVDVSLITAGLNARYMSMLKPEREQAHTKLGAHTTDTVAQPNATVELAKDALYAAKIIDYAQGIKLLQAAGETYGWDFAFEDIVSIWREGCIIRAALLEVIRKTYSSTPDIAHLLLSDAIIAELEPRIQPLREFVASCVARGIPVPAYAGAITYYDAYRTARSSANMIQAQRDFFGAHTFERTDKAGVFHFEWE